jgi:hypothetical protein
MYDLWAISRLDSEVEDSLSEDDSGILWISVENCWKFVQKLYLKKDGRDAKIGVGLSQKKISEFKLCVELSMSRFLWRNVVVGLFGIWIYFIVVRLLVFGFEFGVECGVVLMSNFIFINHFAA